MSVKYHIIIIKSCYNITLLNLAFLSVLSQFHPGINAECFLFVSCVTVENEGGDEVDVVAVPRRGSLTSDDELEDGGSNSLIIDEDADVDAVMSPDTNHNTPVKTTFTLKNGSREDTRGGKGGGGRRDSPPRPHPTHRSTSSCDDADNDGDDEEDEGDNEIDVLDDSDRTQNIMEAYEALESFKVMNGIGDEDFKVMNGIGDEDSAVTETNAKIILNNLNNVVRTKGRTASIKSSPDTKLKELLQRSFTAATAARNPQSQPSLPPTPETTNSTGGNSPSPRDPSTLTPTKDADSNPQLENDTSGKSIFS